MLGMNSLLSNPQSQMGGDKWEPKVTIATRITQQTDLNQSKRQLTICKEDKDGQKQKLKLKKRKELQKKIVEMERMQETMEKKLKNYVKGLEKQLQKKQKQNLELKSKVIGLRGQLNQGMQDVQFLLGYISKKKTSEVQNKKNLHNQPIKNDSYSQKVLHQSSSHPAYLKKSLNMDYWKIKSIN